MVPPGFAAKQQVWQPAKAQVPVLSTLAAVQAGEAAPGSNRRQAARDPMQSAGGNELVGGCAGWLGMWGMVLSLLLLGAWCMFVHALL